MVGRHASVEGNAHHSYVGGQVRLGGGVMKLSYDSYAHQASTTGSTGILPKMEVLKPGKVKAMPPTQGVGREQGGKRDLGAQNT